MFSNLVQNSVFYILDKNSKPTLKIGKVTKVNINPQTYGLSNQDMNISVDINGNPIDWDEIC